MSEVKNAPPSAKIGPAAIDDTAFWNLVEELGWNSHGGHNFDAMRRKITLAYTPEGAAALRGIFDEAFGAIYARLGVDDSDGRVFGKGYHLGDDSFSDLCAHCVGSGRKFYESILKDSEPVKELIKSTQIPESFAYVFPYPDDYAKLEPSYYPEKAERYATLLDEQWSATKAQGWSNHGVETALSTVKSILRLVAESQFADAVEKKEVLVKMMKVLRECGVSSVGYGPDNLISDLERSDLR